MNSFIEYFHHYRDKNDLHLDTAQDAFAAHLSRLGDALLTPPKSGFFKRKTKTPIGLYAWGGVGRGKTMIMDLFFDYLPIAEKRRVHFNIFMLDVHNSIRILRSEGKGKDPLKPIAKEISDACRVLCFDEFQVYDIADAMILSELFKMLFENGVTVVATSNVAPQDLYKNGLQRTRFLPFIDVVKKYMTVIHVDSMTDYRQQAMRENGVYFVGSIKPMEDLFIRMIGTEKVMPRELSMESRKIPIEKAVGEIAWVSFQELCEKPRASADYKMLANAFDIIFIAHVPRMGYDRRNELKRFILLIDILYDAQKRVVIHAEDIPQSLYSGTAHAFEYERTISRLLEMQGEDYLQKTARSENGKSES